NGTRETGRLAMRLVFAALALGCGLLGCGSSTRGAFDDLDGMTASGDATTGDAAEPDGGPNGYDAADGGVWTDVVLADTTSPSGDGTGELSDGGSGEPDGSPVETLAADLVHPTYLAQDDAYLYTVTRAAPSKREIYRIAKSDGALTLVGTIAEEICGFAAAGAYLFASSCLQQSQTLYRVPKTGGVPLPYAPLSAAWPFRGTSDTLWAGTADGLYRIRLADDKVEPFGDSLLQVDAVDVDATHLYALAYKSGETTAIWKLALDSGDGTHLADVQGPSPPRSICVGATDVFYTTGNDPGVVVRVDKSSGQSVPIGGELLYFLPGLLTTDATSVYFAVEQVHDPTLGILRSGFAIWRATLDGSDLAPMISAVSLIFGLVVDDRAIYFTDYDGGRIGRRVKEALPNP
ncbi:MAG: hypothetical protein KC609_24965, partial [Myxococcales bacterium]|nr:hypothetical protein [Myxococcales bacterium]